VRAYVSVVVVRPGRRIQVNGEWYKKKSVGAARVAATPVRQQEAHDAIASKLQRGNTWRVCHATAYMLLMRDAAPPSS